MSKAKKKDVLEFKAPVEIIAEGNEEEGVKTDKKILKRAEKLVRRMDRVLTDINALQVDADALLQSSVELTENDERRFREMDEILGSITNQWYHLTHRMARKYVGKTIDGLTEKRKTL